MRPNRPLNNLLPALEFEVDDSFCEVGQARQMSDPFQEDWQTAIERLGDDLTTMTDIKELAAALGFDPRAKQGMQTPWDKAASSVSF
jgi:hypothetical protein